MGRAFPEGAPALFFGVSFLFWELFMKRYPVSKKASAKKFRGHVGHSKVINLKGAPMRGGIRL